MSNACFYFINLNIFLDCTQINDPRGTSQVPCLTDVHNFNIEYITRMRDQLNLVTTNTSEFPKVVHHNNNITNQYI